MNLSHAPGIAELEVVKFFCYCALQHPLQEVFHVYLNKFEFHFSRLHVHKMNNFDFLLNKGHVPCTTKQTNRQFKA